MQKRLKFATPGADALEVELRPEVREPKTYKTPTLVKLGDFRKLTRGTGGTYDDCETFRVAEVPANPDDCFGIG